MNVKNVTTLGLLGVALGAAACGPGGNFKSKDPFAKSNEMSILTVSNGFGRLLPHVIFEPQPGIAEVVRRGRSETGCPRVAQYYLRNSSGPALPRTPNIAARGRRCARWPCSWPRWPS